MLSLILIPFGLPALQVLGILGERGQLALERGALEQLPAPLELTPQLLLRLGEALQGLSGRLGIEPRERLLQLAQPLLELGRQRPLQQLLHFTQAILERAVVHTRRLGGARNFLDRLRELLYALRHRRLIARDFLGALRRLERHRTVLLSPRPAVRPSGGPTVRIPAPLLGEIPRPVAQLALRRRHRISRARDGTRRLPGLGAQLFHAG